MTRSRSNAASPFARYGSAFWVLGGLLLLTFAIGGSQRADIASLAVLRPVAVVAAAFALWRFRRADAVRARFPLTMAAAITALMIVHLIPLPPSIWSALPGRELIASIDRAAELGSLWRPVSLVPAAGWNALFALAPPIAILLLGLQLDDAERALTLQLILGIGLLSLLIGILQLTGGYGESLYFYTFTNPDSPVGLFANRNHQAAFLAMLFPMLAAYASPVLPSRIDRRIRASIAITGGLLLLPFIIAAGSRAGLILAGMALLAAALLYWRVHPRGAHRDRSRKVAIWGGLAIGASLLMLTAMAITLGRDEAIDRALSSGMTDGSRLENWKAIASVAWSYFPVGSGIGSFSDVYKSAEPYELLHLKVFNHAHNDWLEIFMTAGLPGLILAGIAVIAFGLAATRWWKAPSARGGLIAGAGICVLFLLAAASAVDYPLRVPSLSCFFALAITWMCGPAVGGPEAKEV